jgi:riboflavin transporter FmnP
MSNTMTHDQRLRRMVCAAIFVAFAYITRFFLHFNLMFLTFEIKDAIICIGGLFLGPIYAVVISLLVALIELATISDTYFYGFIMNFLAAAAFSGVASLIYKKWKSLSGAVFSLVIGSISMVGTMLGANLLITPLYMGQPVEAVISLILPLLLPFNAIKTVTNTAIVLLLYKPLTLALTQTGLIKKTTEKKPFRITLQSVLLVIVAVILLFVCIFALIRLLGGSIEIL